MSRIKSPRCQLVTIVATLSIAISLSACSSSSTSSTASSGQATGQPSPYLSANLVGVSCGTGELCAGVGAPFDPNPTSPALTMSTDGGATWHQAKGSVAATTRFQNVACSQQSCLAIGTEGLKLVFISLAGPNVAWSSASQLPQSAVPKIAACAQTKWCIVIGETPSGLISSTTTTAGRTWGSPVSLPSGIAHVLSLSCSSAQLCIGTGITENGLPQIVTTSDGGATWGLPTLPSGMASVLSGSCRSKTQCFVVARNASSPSPGILTSDDAGATFAFTPAPSDLTTPNAVSCASTTCVYVGASSTSKGAAASQTQKNPVNVISTSYVPTALLGVSCSLPTRCVGFTTSSLVAISPLVPQSGKQ